MVGKRTRHENGLVELTKKFINLIKEAPEQCVDLSDTVGKLALQKRRIYDITNVLEGIGLIVKYKKNKFKWIGLENMQYKIGGDTTQNTKFKRRKVGEDNDLI